MEYTLDETNLGNDVVRTKSGQKARVGRSVTYGDELDQEIVMWILQQWELQVPISMDFICSLYAQTLVCEQFPDFKASRGWLTKFMKRRNSFLRAKTSMAQKLHVPTQLDQHIEKLINYLRTTREEEDIDNDMILNMDKTPVYFDIVPNKTVDIKGTKTVQTT